MDNETPSDPKAQITKESFPKEAIQEGKENTVIVVPADCQHPPLTNRPADNAPELKMLEFAHDLIYNDMVAQKLDDISGSVEAIKAFLVGLGLANFDKDIEGSSDTQILPDGGKESMARLRGRNTLNHETVMIGAPTVQALIEKVASMVAESMKNGIAAPNKNVPTFKEYASDWMENCCRLKVEKTTYNGYQSYLDAQLYDAFGTLRLDEITAAKIQEFINDHKDYQTSTLKKYINLLSLILQAAIEDQYVTVDAAKSRKIVYPRKEKKERKPLTEEQLKDILSNIHKLEPLDQQLLALLIFTGARRGEVLGLKAMDIDWENKLIHLRRQIRYPGTNKGEMVDFLKMGKKGRDIPILEQLRPFLPKDGGDRLLFHTEGSPLSSQQYKNTWTRIKNTINLYGATAHVLRHTFLTYANNHGADPKTLQTLAGHSSAQFTLSQYVHPQTEQLQRIGGIISNELNKL